MFIIMYLFPKLSLCMCVQWLSHIRFFATQWTVAHQTPLSMNFPGKNTGIGCHFLLQGIFPTQLLKLSLVISLSILKVFLLVIMLECTRSIPCENEGLNTPVSSGNAVGLRHDLLCLSQAAHIK